MEHTQSQPQAAPAAPAAPVPQPQAPQQTTVQPTQKKKGGGCWKACLVGCLVILVLVILLGVVLGWWIYRHGGDIKDYLYKKASDTATQQVQNNLPAGTTIDPNQIQSQVQQQVQNQINNVQNSNGTGY